VDLFYAADFVPYQTFSTDITQSGVTFWYAWHQTVYSKNILTGCSTAATEFHFLLATLVALQFPSFLVR
jgi:hypothetical protein